MSVGKYSPTVSYAYQKDQDWWVKNGGGSVDVNYDNDGYDRYGYDKYCRDRAGYYEDDYIVDGKWVDDEFVYELAEDVYRDWSCRLPQGIKFEG